MPDFEYRGAPGLYPTLRDAYGVLAGTVAPGDVLEFSQAPDADWVPYESGDGPEWVPHADPAGAPGWRISPPGEADDTGQDGIPADSPHASDDEAGTGQEEG